MDATEAKPKRRRSKHLHRQKAKQERKKHAKRQRSEAHQRALADAAVVEDERAASRAAMEAGIATFEAYYRAQGLCVTEHGSGEEELADVVKALLRPLPVTFRVCKDVRRASTTSRALAQILPLLKDKTLGAQFADTEAVFWEWCHAWQLPCNDRALKEASLLSQQDYGLAAPAQEDAAQSSNRFAQLRKWLTENTEAGIVTRQEIASMVPVALLAIQPCHAVLDLCASPGSKTTQALEALHSQFGEEGQSSWPAGFVVANELDSGRSYVLAKRCAALEAAASSCIVTTHRAQIFPRPRSPIFDRIICDVPCSGDGTFRKYRDKWRHWQPHQGRQLHSLQIQIGLRALSLLKVGGVMSYSTCSLNPLEDESVVAALLQRCAGAVEVVDVRGRLPGFETRPGMTHWQVLTDDLTVLPSHAEARTSLAANEARRYRSSMWPPARIPGGGHDVLRHCVRLLPDANNTGGFFVALLRKTRAWPPARKVSADKEGADFEREGSGNQDLPPREGAEEAVGGEERRRDRCGRGVGAQGRPSSGSGRPVLRRVSAAYANQVLQSVWPKVAADGGQEKRAGGGEGERQSCALQGHVLVYWAPRDVMEGEAGKPRRVYAISRTLAENYLGLTEGGACMDDRLSAVSAGVCFARREKGAHSAHDRWVLTTAGEEMIRWCAAQ